MNLLTDPWLPLLRHQGGLEWRTPAELTDNFADDPFVSFGWGRPDLEAAALELCIGLLQAAFPPLDEDDWLRRWMTPPAPDVLAPALEPFVPAFELMGTPAFMQDLDADRLEAEEVRPIEGLLIDAPGAMTVKNRADWFVRSDPDRVLAPAAAAMALYTLQAYASSGGVGHRTGVRGGGPLSVLPLVRRPHHPVAALFDRIWPSVGCRTDDDRNPFAWMEPTQPSNARTGGGPVAPAAVPPTGLFFTMPRRIRLVFEAGCGRRCPLTDTTPDQVAVGFRALNYGNNYAEGFIHPLTPYYRPAGSEKKKKPLLPTHVHPGGLSYKLWPSALIGSDTRRPSAAMAHFVARRAPQLAAHGQAAAWLSGFDMDNAKARVFVEGEQALFVVPPLYQGRMSDQVGRAAACGSLVAGAVRRAVAGALGLERDASYLEELFFRVSEPELIVGLSMYQQTLLRDEEGALPPDALDGQAQDLMRTWLQALRTQALRLYDEQAGGVSRWHGLRRYWLIKTLDGQDEPGKALYKTANLPIPQEEDDAAPDAAAA